MKHISTRTKAELVATFVVAYCVLLATAPDLAHWASSQSLIARTAPCPVNPIRVGCRPHVARVRRPGRAGRSRVVHISVGRSGTAAAGGRSEPVRAVTSQAQARLGAIDRSSSTLRVEVAALNRRVRHVVASTTSVSKPRHAPHASRRARVVHRRAPVN